MCEIPNSMCSIDDPRYVEYEFKCEHCKHIWYIELPQGSLRSDAGLNCPECTKFCENIYKIED